MTDDLLFDVADSIVADLTYGSAAGSVVTTTQGTSGSGYALSDSVRASRRLPPLKLDPDVPLVRVGVAGGRTVGLANREFAKIDISLGAVAPAHARESIFDWLDALMRSMLDREVAGLKHGKSAKTAVAEFCEQHYAPHGSALRMSLGLGYGLTINLGGYEYSKPAVSLCEMFAPSDFGPVWADMSASLGARIRDLVNDARNPAGSVELGA